MIYLAPVAAQYAAESPLSLIKATVGFVECFRASAISHPATPDPPVESISSNTAFIELSLLAFSIAEVISSDDEISLLDYWHLPQKVIYCRLADQNKMLARMSLAFKAHKPLEHTNAVIENYKAVCTEYESVMSDAKRAGVNIFKYDWEVTSLQSLKDWI